MKNLWILGLMLIAPLTAHAAPAMGIVAMAPIRAQVKSAAIAAHQLQKGERLTVRTLQKATSSKPGLIKASIWVRGFNGPLHQGMKKTLMIQASANFKVQQTSEGQIAVPVKQDGQVWLHYLHALNK